MTEKIRWGILSTANIGRKRVVPAMQASAHGIVTAVASRNIDAAREYADELGIATAYGSYEELLADPNIDAIYNPLPNSLHAEWSIQCAEAGKPTLCEKPLASDAAEAQMMVDAFAERSVLFAEAFMYRFHPQTVQVKQMLDDGAIGDLLAVEASFSFRLTREDNIRSSAELAGGALMDVGCYCVNVTRLMTGAEPVAGHAVAHFGATSGVDEVLAGVLKFETGVVGHFDCSLRGQHNHRYHLRGTHGKITVEEAFVMSPDRATFIRWWQAGPDGDTYREITVPPANSYTLMADDFALALIDGRPPRYTPQDGVENMRVIDMLLQSARA